MGSRVRWLLAIAVLVGSAGRAAHADMPRLDIGRIYVEGAVRMGTGPGNVPYREKSDEDYSASALFGSFPMPWHVQAGGVLWVERWMTYGHARLDGFRPVEDGATPWIVTAVGGLGRTFEKWDEGGAYDDRSTTHERRNKYTGQVCETPGEGEVYADGCVEDWAVTRTERRYEPPGMVKGWYAAYAGWRHGRDLRIDDAAALAAAGGPVLGVTTTQRKELGLNIMFDVEAGYYAVGPKHGLSGMARLGAGLPWLFVDLVGRLDGVVGNELSLGVALRLGFDP